MGCFFRWVWLFIIFIEKGNQAVGAVGETVDGVKMGEMRKNEEKKTEIVEYYIFCIFRD